MFSLVEWFYCIVFIFNFIINKYCVNSISSSVMTYTKEEVKKKTWGGIVDKTNWRPFRLIWYLNNDNTETKLTKTTPKTK